MSIEKSRTFKVNLSAIYSGLVPETFKVEHLNQIIKKVFSGFQDSPYDTDEEFYFEAMSLEDVDIFEFTIDVDLESSCENCGSLEPYSIVVNSGISYCINCSEIFNEMPDIQKQPFFETQKEKRIKYYEQKLNLLK